jgi:hypothetical protein
MEITAKHVIAFRPRSPLAAILENLCYCHLGNKDQDCLAVSCSKLSQGMPGFLDAEIEHQSIQTPFRIQIALSEILLISDAQGNAQPPIGFLRAG